MIRRKEPDVRLFYPAEEMYRPAGTNFYCRLNAAVGSWEALCAPLRSAFFEGMNGRPVDPAVYFKIYLVGYLENITFDTDLAERIGDSLAIREFLGYAPHERTPDHSRISAVRDLFSTGDLLEQVMDKVVGLCCAAGLVSGGSVAVDSTLIPANASLSSLKCVRSSKTVREHFDELRGAEARLRLPNAEFRSRTDPDARIAKKGASCPRGMYHKATYVADSKSQVVLCAQASPADQGDPEAAMPVLERAGSRLVASGLGLGTVLGDTGYDDSKFHRFVEDLGATPLTKSHRGPCRAGVFGKDAFRWDAQRQVYICPAGRTLMRNGHDQEKLNFRSAKRDCDVCPLRGACLDPGKRRRMLSRSIHEDARTRNRQRAGTAAGKAALDRRGCIVEPPFGDMKRHGGLRTVNCRTGKRVGVKILMAAITWNLKKLARTVPTGLVRPLSRLHRPIPAPRMTVPLPHRWAIA